MTAGSRTFALMPGVNLAVWAASLVALHTVAKGQTEWKSGAAFDQAARSITFDLRWEQARLGEQVRLTSRSCGLAVMIDRRVDPEQLVQFQTSGATLPLLLLQVGEPLGLGVGRSGSFYYFGPSRTALGLAGRIRRFQAELSGPQTPASVRGGWSREVKALPAEPFNPVEWLRQTADERKLPVDGWDQLPHDFWEPVELPALPFSTVFVAFIAGFGCEPQVGAGGRVRIGPEPEEEPLMLELPARGVGAEAMATLSGLPGFGKSPDRNMILLEGSIENLLEAIRVLSRRSGTGSPRGTGDIRLTLSAEARRGDILRSVVAQQKLVLTDPGPELAGVLQEIVRVDVRQVTLQDLLRQTFSGSGWEPVLSGNELRIVRQPESDRGK